MYIFRKNKIVEYVILFLTFSAIFTLFSTVKTEATEYYEENGKTYELVKYELPDEDTYFKSYMSYKAITNVESQQYKLQKKAWTDDWGFRRTVDDYIVAVGTYYSDTVGDRFKITLSCGSEFTVTVGDIKADAHTDSKNQYRAVYNENGKFVSANVLEFIVDTSVLPKEAKLSGTVSSIYYFKGNITKIEKIV